MAVGTAARSLGVTSHRGTPTSNRPSLHCGRPGGSAHSPRPAPWENRGGSLGANRASVDKALSHTGQGTVLPPCPLGRPGFLAGRRATREAPGEGRCEQVVLGQERHLESREQRVDLDTDLTPSIKPAENGTLNKKTQQRKTSRRKHRREIYVNFHLVICC